MILFLLAYLGGVLTILSPCILPVLPFVFARADRPFVRSGLPMLAGMALTFAAVATLAAVAGGWAVAANQYGRTAAIALLAVFGLTLLFQHLADRLTRPLVALGGRLSSQADTGSGAGGASVLPSFLLGIATGLLWAPCAGPVLGLILTGAALGGASVGTSLLLFAYAAGAATSLALALLVGGRVFRAMKRSLGVGEWVRRGLGVAVLAGVAAIALGLDTGLLTQVSLSGTASLEQRLLDRFHPDGALPPPSTEAAQGPAVMTAAVTGPSGDAAKPAEATASATPASTSTGTASTPSTTATPAAAMVAAPPAPEAPATMVAAPAAPSAPAPGVPSTTDAPIPPVTPAAVTGDPTALPKPEPAVMKSEPLPVEGSLPPLGGAVEWLNSPPLSAAALKGKVVVVEFWTYSCINCLRSLPYVRAWAEKYKDQGLVVIGVHAPEFAFEKRIDNVKKAVADLKIGYPVAIDNDYAIWRSFKNQYWPAHYFIDAQGRIRHHHFGEGEYAESERIIQQLLAESGRSAVKDGIVTVSAEGAQAAAAPKADVKSPETYVGTGRAENFASPGGFAEDEAHVYAPGSPKLNQWGLSGKWKVGEEQAALQAGGGSIVYRFHARDLHLVLGPAASGKPVRFKVTIDGAAPGDNHGVDTDASGSGTVTGQRLYQLVRQNGPVADHTFEITFSDPGVQAYAFTFG